MTPQTPSLRRRTSRVLAAMAAVALVASCGGNADTSGNAGDKDLQQVTLMLNWTPNAHHAGIYYAQEQGLYTEAGIDLKILEPGADIDAAAAVAQEKVQFGISQAESVLPAREAGMDVQAIATLLSVNDSVLMGLKGSGLTNDPGSLAGLTYGGYGGALETEIMSELTRCGGGNPKDVEFIDIGNVDYLAGLEKERFDVTWVFGGWDALRATAKRDDVVTIPMSDHEDCIPNWYTPVIIGSGAAMSKDPDLARSFLDATSSGYEAVAADPAAGADAMLTAVPEMDADLVKRAVDYYAPLYAQQGRFGTMEDKVWKRFTSFLVQAKMLKDESSLEGAWTNDHLPDD